jgi:serine/threonine protein kinase
MTEGRIGKFEIASRIGTGGMADVFRCRLRGMGGFEKTVVVKRIRAERASDPSFVNMFFDEARLAANLSHPNIVQVFEIGEVDGAPYIAMEYVNGPTFAALSREARRRQRMHLGHVAKIVAGVCEGLHHAHSARSTGGEPLGLVHRDVSPQNILVSGEGIPKLLDFGVAKANGRLTETQAGTLKGRLRYMSPEQLNGNVDRRADIFSLGVCLYEATTGHHPYGPPLADEVSLLGSIGSGKFARPSELVPEYPRALEDVVMWAMAPDVDQRCPTAQALQARLDELVASARGPLASSTREVADWVNQLFPELAEGSGPVPRAPLPLARRVGNPRRRYMSAFNPLAAVLSPETATGTAPASPVLVARQSARRRARRTTVAALGAGLGLAAGLAAAAVMVRGPRGAHDGDGRPAREVAAAGASAALRPAALPVARPAAAALAEGAAQAYVEAAEKLVAGGQPGPAAELLAKARGLDPRGLALLARLAELDRSIAVDDLLGRAARHLADGQPREASALASQVLEQDADNRAAAEILSRARTGPPAAPAPRRRSHPARVHRADAPRPEAGPAVAAARPAPGEGQADALLGEGETDPALAGTPRPPPGTPHPQAASAPAPASGRAGAGGNAPPERAPAAIYSARPLSKVPPPRLPRVHRAQSPEDLDRVLALVEQEAVEAGCSALFTRGITAALRRALAGQSNPELYPAALYYLIVREAALGREREAAGRELASAHRSGVVKALNRLPVDTRNRL